MGKTNIIMANSETTFVNHKLRDRFDTNIDFAGGGQLFVWCSMSIKHVLLLDVIHVWGKSSLNEPIINMLVYGLYGTTACRKAVLLLLLLI